MDFHNLSLSFQSKEIILWDNENPKKGSLSISRTPELEIYTNDSIPEGGRPYNGKINAIIGTLNLLSGPFLIVSLQNSTGALTSTSERYEAQTASYGTRGIDVFGHRVYEIRYVDLIQILPDSSRDPLTTEQIKYEDRFKQLIADLLSFGYFFSYTFDLTNTLARKQKENRLENEWDWSHVDKKFVWNCAHNEKFIPFIKSFGRWAVPIICGSVLVSHNLTIKNKKCSFYIISRKGIQRAGTRFNSRGVDEKGEVSNFTETEQILYFPDPEFLYGFVQTRGSIPVFWQQSKENFKWEPKIDVDNERSPSAFKKHFEQQFKKYNDQIILNLVKKTGSEKVLGDAYKQQVEELHSEKIKYVDFDVHHHCGNTKFENLSILFDEINSDIEKYGAFVKNGSTVETQSATFRTNCKDCLDRTNLIQGAVAKANLVSQLKKNGIINSDEEVLDDDHFMNFFRNIWADNGDMISILYAGTPALKSDVTRTGKSSLNQLKNDGLNAVTRYYLNSFADGERQDSVDLFLGNYDLTPILSHKDDQKDYSILWFLTVFLSFFIILGPSHGTLMKLWHPFLIFIGAAFLFIFSLILRIRPHEIINRGVFQGSKKKNI